MKDSIVLKAEERLKKTTESVRHQMAGVRSGKASTSLLDSIKVPYYGTPTPLHQVANLSAPEPRLIIVQPWEKSIVGEIGKAILASDLGLNPQIDGQIIRIPIPPLSEERRKDLVKLTRKMGEDGKVAMRNVRRDANEEMKKAEKAKEISEDEMEKGEAEIQKLLDQYIGKIDELMRTKEKEIMEV